MLPRPTVSWGIPASALCVLILTGVSARTVSIEDPAELLAQAYQAQSEKSSNLNARANVSCSDAAMIKVCARTCGVSSYSWVGKFAFTHTHMCDCAVQSPAGSDH